MKKIKSFHDDFNITDLGYTLFYGVIVTMLLYI